MAGERQQRVPPAENPYVHPPLEQVVIEMPEGFEQNNEQNNEADVLSDADVGPYSNTFWILIATSIIFLIGSIWLIFYSEYYRHPK